jgi:hypothetical protein
VPWAFGPILTAGVALGAAAVVVSNPVVVPRADVQISARELSATLTDDGHREAAIAMLDEDFIRAVGPEPAASTNPLAVLTDLVRVIVADAAYLGKNAILHAFTTGARVIADPALTSTSYPYVPVEPPGAAIDPAAMDPAALPWPTPTAPVADPGDLGPVVAQALTEILADVSHAGDVRAIAAAFAAGAALATEYFPVMGAVVGSVGDGIGLIIDGTVSVIAVLPRTGAVIGDGIRTVIAQLPLIAPPPIVPPSIVPPSIVPPSIVPPSIVPPSITPPVSGAVTEEPTQSSGENTRATATEDLDAASPLADRRTRGAADRADALHEDLDAARDVDAPPDPQDVPQDAPRDVPRDAPEELAESEDPAAEFPSALPLRPAAEADEPAEAAEALQSKAHQPPRQDADPAGRTGGEPAGRAIR